MGAQEDTPNGVVPLTVRMSRAMHELVREEAEHDGISTAQLIREATLLRVGWGRGRRGEPMPNPRDARTVRRLLEHLHD